MATVLISRPCVCSLRVATNHGASAGLAVSAMVTASLVSTIVAISLPPAMLLLLAQRSKKRSDNFPQEQQHQRCSITSHMGCRLYPTGPYHDGHDLSRGRACRYPSVALAGLLSALLTTSASAVVRLPPCGMHAEIVMTFRGLAPLETTMRGERVGTRCVCFWLVAVFPSLPAAEHIFFSRWVFKMVDLVPFRPEVVSTTMAFGRLSFSICRGC